MKDKRLWLPIRNGRFGRLWLGQAASQIGTRMYQIAIAWWIVQSSTEGAGFRLGLLFLVASLPAILFSRKIGSFVDRIAPRTLIIICELAAGFICAGLFFLCDTPIMQWAIYPAAFLLSLAQSLVDPAIFKITPHLLEQKDLEEGMGLVNSTQSLASLAGASFGALAMGVFGLSGSIVFNAACYGLSALFRYTVRTEVERSDASSLAAPSSARLIDIAGFSLVRAILYAFALINFFSVPTLIIMPVYTKNVLAGNASLLAGLEAALALGILAGSMGSKYLPESGSPFRTIALCVVAFGAFLGLPSLFTHVLVYGASLMGAGASLGLMNVKILTFFQTVIPESHKGRFFAHLNALTSLTFPASFFLFGLLTDFVSLGPLIGSQSAGILVLSVLFFRFEDTARRTWSHLAWT